VDCSGVRASGHGFENDTEGVEANTQRKAILEHDPMFEGDGMMR
jgi:hypothetical protein